MSTETNFTPGPWSLDNNDVRDEAQAVESEATGCIVAEACTLDRPGDCEANAHLIAAAPELYEALEGIMRAEARDRVMPAGAEWDAARAALAKARGES